MIVGTQKQSRDPVSERALLPRMHFLSVKVIYLEVLPGSLYTNVTHLPFVEDLLSRLHRKCCYLPCVS